MKYSIAKNVIAIAIVSVLSSASFAAYSGGSGTSADPYLISTPAQLDLLGQTSSDWGKSFKLTADVDLSGYTGKQFHCIGVGGSFAGTFDGDSHIISNFTYIDNDSNRVGLFGTSSGTIKNLTVKNVNVVGKEYVGGIIGSTSGSSGAVTDCAVIGGKITGIESVGGIIGYNSKLVTSCSALDVNVSGEQYIGGVIGWSSTAANVTIDDCVSSGSVNGLNAASVNGITNAGGIIGRLYRGNVSDCNSSSVVTGGGYLGGLIGNIFDSSCVIENCHASGSVTGIRNAKYDSVGGLVGGSDGAAVFSKCSASGKVIGANYVGGLVGSGKNFSECIATGDVNGVERLGGLVGSLIGGGSISKCKAIGDVEGSANYVGGLVGRITNIAAGSTITQSCAFGEVYGEGSYVGGLMGDNYAGTVSNCYSVCSVVGNDYVGGLIGSDYAGNDSNCFAAGYLYGKKRAGRLIGAVSSSTVVGCFWDKSSGQTVSAGGTGKTTAEMQSSSTFTSAGWNFTNVWEMSSSGYPHLIKKFYAGSGTSVDPYRIGSVANWLELTRSYWHWDKNFILTDDLYMAGANVVPIGIVNSKFTGVLDGQGHIIHNADISPEFGLFGYTGAGSQIKNLGVEDVNVLGGYYAGGLVAYNDGGTIKSCFTTGTVRINSYWIGGLVGYNNHGKIIRCYSTGVINGGTSSVGGLCGSAGDPNGGYEDTGNFWDTQTSQKSNSAMGTGKTTAEMKTLSTFTNAGWDFSAGTGDWQMPSSSYPRLIWENVTTTVTPPLAPENVSATDGKYTDKVTITWTASSGATAYDVYRFTSNTSASSVKINTSDVTGTSYNDTSEVAGTTYWYWVKAKNTGGTSGFSNGDSGYKKLPPPTPTVSVQKCSVTAGNNNLDGISFSGSLNAADGDFMAAMNGNVVVSVDSDLMSSPKTFTFPITAATYKKGKFSGKITNTSFSFDTKKQKFTFAAKKTNLTGLACPFTVTITIGGYSAQVEIDETIVNGAKPIPVQLMMGVQDSLTVTKYTRKSGKKVGTDTLAAQGTFTIDGVCDVTKKTVINIGAQSFTIPENSFVEKNGVYTCKNINTANGLATVKLDENKCTFSITITKASIPDVGVSNFNLNLFGHSL